MGWLGAGAVTRRMQGAMLRSIQAGKHRESIHERYFPAQIHCDHRSRDDAGIKLAFRWQCGPGIRRRLRMYDRADEAGWPVGTIAAIATAGGPAAARTARA